MSSRFSPVQLLLLALALIVVPVAANTFWTHPIASPPCAGGENELPSKYNQCAGDAQNSPYTGKVTHVRWSFPTDSPHASRTKFWVVIGSASINADGVTGAGVWPDGFSWAYVGWVGDAPAQSPSAAAEIVPPMTTSTINGRKWFTVDLTDLNTPVWINQGNLLILAPWGDTWTDPAYLGLCDSKESDHKLNQYVNYPNNGDRWERLTISGHSSVDYAYTFRVEERLFNAPSVPKTPFVCHNEPQGLLFTTCAPAIATAEGTECRSCAKGTNYIGGKVECKPAEGKSDPSVQDWGAEWRFKEVIQQLTCMPPVCSSEPRFCDGINCWPVGQQMPNTDCMGTVVGQTCKKCADGYMRIRGSSMCEVQPTDVDKVFQGVWKNDDPIQCVPIKCMNEPAAAVHSKCAGTGHGQQCTQCADGYDYIRGRAVCEMGMWINEAPLACDRDDCQTCTSKLVCLPSTCSSNAPITGARCSGTARGETCNSCANGFYYAGGKMECAVDGDKLVWRNAPGEDELKCIRYNRH